MIVAPPARPLRQVAFDYSIDDSDRIDDDWVIRGPNSQPDQVEKIAADDVSGRKGTAAVDDNHLAPIRVGRSHGLFRIGGREANVVAGFSFHEFAATGDHPFFHVARKPVSVIQ